MNDEERQTFEKLQQALVLARSKINQQQQVLMELTSPPLAFGVVVGIADLPPRTLTEADLVKGKQVMLTHGDKAGMIGEIIQEPDDSGDIRIRVEGERIWLSTVNPSTRLLRSNVAIELLPEHRVTVLSDGKMLEVLNPLGKSLQIGQTVLLATASGHIVDTREVDFAGDVSLVVRRLDSSLAEVSNQGSPRAVYVGRFPEVKQGDRVVLDNSGSVIVFNLGPEQARYSFTTTANVPWTAIGGLDDAKALLQEGIAGYRAHPDLYAAYSKTAPKGYLLYGPPGCGKTMLGKAVATAVAAANGHYGTASFMYVKGPEILSHYVGDAELAIRTIFAQARHHQELAGYPAVIFIDEAESLLRRRGTGISSDIETTIVPMFLAEMDGLSATGAIVILATNRPDMLDPAVVRDGRIDRKIRVERPTPETARDIFRIYLQNLPFANSDLDELIEVAVSALFSQESHPLYELHLKNGSSRTFTLAQLVNGGMIAGVVDRATSIAMKRDLADGQKPSGVSVGDIRAAVEQVYLENKDLDHSDELHDFAADFGDYVERVRRVVTQRVAAGG